MYASPSSHYRVLCSITRYESAMTSRDAASWSVSNGALSILMAAKGISNFPCVVRWESRKIL